MEKYESNYDYDPQTYCRICDGNLRGIRHLTSKKCKNIELAKAKPPPSRVEQDYEKIETKEDNSEKETREEKNHETPDMRKTSSASSAAHWVSLGHLR